jgi:hypothetical protein
MNSRKRVKEKPISSKKIKRATMTKITVTISLKRTKRRRRTKTRILRKTKKRRNPLKKKLKFQTTMMSLVLHLGESSRSQETCII